MQMYVTVVGEVTVDDGGGFVVEEVDEMRFPIRNNNCSMDEAPDHK